MGPKRVPLDAVHVHPGMTSAMYAAQVSTNEIMTLLIQAGAKVDSQVLQQAVENNRVDMVQHLLSKLSLLKKKMR